MIGSIQQARFVTQMQTISSSGDWSCWDIMSITESHCMWIALKCFGSTFDDHQNQQKKSQICLFVKINFVWMRIICVPRETDFACYLIKPRRNCFQVNSAFNFGACEHIAPCFNFSKVKCETWILTSILKSSQSMNIIGSKVNLANDTNDI